ncbi:unnamed protein product [Effrenium voratum]|nr:unnamed protein product [Effrenium voratum]
MLPAVRRDVAGKWTCDVCGKHCSEQLFVFRAFLRKEHLDPRAERCLDPFVAYISERCGRGLLGQLSEYARFKEEVFGLTTGSTDLDTARAQLEESLRRCSREDRQFLIDELERLAGVGPAGAPKTVEMEAVERLVVGPSPAALLRTAEDAFRALARTLAPRVGARLLACAALQRGLAEGATGYLQSVASSLAAGGPLPQAPSPWPLKQAAACIEAVLRAANEGAGRRLSCGWSWRAPGTRRSRPSARARRI